MRSLKLFALPAVAALCCFIPASQQAQAQVSFGVSVGGPQPVCPYGYFDYSPYNCAPYGYYGPEWFNNGVFIGAGPWYHGDRNWHGHIDRHYDPRYGYHGALPSHDEHWHGYRQQDFHGRDVYQGRTDNRGGEHMDNRGGGHMDNRGGNHTDNRGGNRDRGGDHGGDNH